MSTTADYTGWPPCVMCGAKRNEPCTVISGSGEPGDSPGNVRYVHHAQRAKPEDTGTDRDPGDDFIAVKDEPNHYRGEPHTAQCGPDCPLREGTG